MTKKKMVVPLTERALVQRLRRALAKDGARLLVNRSDDRYFIVNDRNAITDSDVDLVGLAKTRGLLQPWERVEVKK